MFIHPTQDYNILLHLDPSILPRYLHNVNVDQDLLTRRGKYANKTLQDDAVKVLPGFDPAQLFVDDLQVRPLRGIFLISTDRILLCQRIYADTFKVFYDPYGGTQIGAVWDPTLKELRPFRVLGGFNSVPLKKVRCNFH